MPDLPALPELSLEEKLAQLIVVRIGSNLPPIVKVSDDEQRIAELLSKCPVGGLLLFNGQWPDAAQTLARLQASASIPLLVAADLERGAGQQIEGLTVFPHAAAFGRAGQTAPQLVRDAAAETARAALAAGVQIVFGPVADVATNPANPIISTRAYGETPAQAGELVAAAVEGLESAGAFATAKHFPGHGDTSQDSHAELPQVDRPLESLAQQELPPFERAIAAGVSLMMTAHVSYPQLDPTGAPATFSREILTGILRERLGFDGAICTDSLLMEGARAGFDSEADMACAALNAGVDILLDVADPVATVAGLKARVDAGDLPIATVDQAVGRVMALKARCGEQPPIESSPPQSSALSAEVARLAVQAEPGATPGPLLDTSQSLAVVLFKPFELPTDPPEQPLAQQLRQRFSDVQYFELGPHPTPEQIESAAGAASAAAQTALIIIAKPAAWHAFGMTEAQAALAERITDRDRVVIASLGVPTILDGFPARHPKVCAYSDVPVSQAALADALANDASTTP